MIAPVVPRTWVEQHPEVVLADVRWYLDGRSGRAAYEAGHLPGAVFVDLDRWLAAPPSAAAGRHPLPDPAVFAQGMQSLGVGDADTVVAYDDDGGVIAARLVWLLRVTGHDAALLDGGLTGWDAPLEAGAWDPTGVLPKRFTAAPWPQDALADIAEVTDPDVLLLDARDRERYRGDTEPVDPRAGHIPGARNVPCRANVQSDGRLLHVEQLRRRFAEAGVTSASPVVAYCGSGVTACHTLLTLELAGFPGGRLYPGSWSQYSATDRPAAVGE